MIQYILYLIMIFINFLFFQMKHPLTMGLILLTQTLLICMNIGLKSPSFWFSYILFLIFIGGMLILFIYVISLISNEKFKMMKLKNLNMLMMMSIILMLTYSLNLDTLMMKDIFMNKNFMDMLINNFFSTTDMINLNKLYMYPTNLINLLMVNYLFLMLVITVKITKFFYGPMRIKNYLM